MSLTLPIPQSRYQKGIPRHVSHTVTSSCSHLYKRREAVWYKRQWQHRVNWTWKLKTRQIDWNHARRHERLHIFLPEHRSGYCSTSYGIYIRQTSAEKWKGGQLHQPWMPPEISRRQERRPTSFKRYHASCEKLENEPNSEGKIHITRMINRIVDQQWLKTQSNNITFFFFNQTLQKQVQHVFMNEECSVSKTPTCKHTID